MRYVLIFMFPSAQIADPSGQIGRFIAGWLPFAAALVWSVGVTLHWHLRAPDIVITVSERPTPLMAKFAEQDRRLERRERLKRQLFDLNSEIETFNAGLDADERHAWFNRPGPYGK